MSSKDYEKAQRSIDRVAERLKKTGAEKSSEAARKRAERIARETEKTSTKREK